MTDQQRRAIKVWQVLISCAHRHETITYGRVAELIAEPIIPLRLGLYLDRIQAFCLARGLPNLAVIVVNATTGRPRTRELSYTTSVEQEQAAVFDTDWFAQTPPVADDFQP